MGTAPVRVGPAVPDSEGRRDIPSLDGLRAVSIGLVILAHTRALLPSALVQSGVFRYIVGGGLAGVEVFFVISGYLITTLLLREFARTQSVSLRRFYARRSLRIFPPFYAYMTVLAILWIAGQVPEHGPSFLAAATYTIVYLSRPQGWNVSHTWSLSIEEQFYLLWPAILLFAQRRRRTIRLVVLALGVMPLVRLLLWVVIAHPPGIAPHAVVTTGAVDTLMTGCLLALLRERSGAFPFPRLLLGSSTAALLFVVGFVLVPRVEAKAGGIAALLAATCGVSVTALCIGGILCHVVGDGRGLAGRFLNLPAMRHLGVVSYSLYLWQQLFTDAHAQLGTACYLWMLLAAELSYWGIEKPVERWRVRLKPDLQCEARPAAGAG